MHQAALPLVLKNFENRLHEMELTLRRLTEIVLEQEMMKAEELKPEETDGLYPGQLSNPEKKVSTEQC